MDPTPQAIATTTFRIVKKGYDPDEVRAFLGEVARTVDTAQAHSQAMESRARQALSRVQELTANVQVAAQPQTQVASASTPDADAISKVLVTAQRVADQTMADASREADQILARAKSEHDRLLGEASTAAARAVNDARASARLAGDSEKAKVADEIDGMLDRLDLLKADVSLMEQHASFHRSRLREIAEELRAAADSPHDGLAPVGRPTLSGAADERSQPAVVDIEPQVAVIPNSELPTMSIAIVDDSVQPDAVGSAVESSAASADPTPPENAVPTLESLFASPVTQEVPLVALTTPPSGDALPEPGRPGGMRIIED